MCTEREIQDAFERWLGRSGWTIEQPTGPLAHLDVLAVRESERLYAEVKGRTAAMGTDLDTGFGQLLRRIPTDPDPSLRFALVVPTAAERLVNRVPARIRAVLGIDVYLVHADGSVEPRAPGS